MDELGALRPDDQGPDAGTPALSVEQLLYRAIIQCELEALDREHVLIVTDRDTHATYSGPYPDALSALTAAQDERARREHAGLAGSFNYCIAPVYPSQLADPIHGSDEGE